MQPLVHTFLSPVERMIRARQFVCRAGGVFLMLALFFLCFAFVRADELVSTDGTLLLGKYAEIKGELEKNPFGMPIHVESKELGRSLSGDVYGIVNYPYKSIMEAVTSPPVWCYITPLDLNIKACTHLQVDDRSELTLYTGRKYYQPPEDAYKLKFLFQVVAQTPEYLDISLSAGKGPLFTRDYRIRLEAAPVGTARTFVHFSYAYRFGMLARMFTNAYFASIGRGKKGFSIVGADSKGNPVYVKGVRGALERNAVRYYLALLAYLDTRSFPAGERFDRRINEWFDLTTRYPLQLYEMDKEEYLSIKRREHDNQLRLQEESEK